MKVSSILSRTSRVGRALRRAFTHNIGLKVLSLAVAIGLFSMVRGSEDASRSFFVDVVVLLPPPGSQKMLVSDVPDKVRLTVRGSRSLVNSIHPEELAPVQVDLRDASGSYYYFDPDDFEIPAGVQIVQIAPASIPLSWAARVSEDLPVLPQLSGSPGPGLSAEIVSVEPSTVQVVGPETEVDALKQIKTDPIDVSDLPTGRHDRRVPLEQAPDHTQVSRVAVRVTFEVVAQEAQRTFDGVEISTIGRPVAQVRPDRVDLTVWGPSADIDQLKPWQLVPTIDAASLDAEGGTQELSVDVRGLPDGLQVRASPETVLVTPRSAAR